MELADLFYYQTFLIESEKGRSLINCFQYETYDHISETSIYKAYEPVLNFLKRCNYSESDIDLLDLMITEKCEEIIMNLFPYND
jgi:hypothetical protein